MPPLDAAHPVLGSKQRIAQKLGMLDRPSLQRVVHWWISGMQDWRPTVPRRGRSWNIRHEAAVDVERPLPAGAEPARSTRGAIERLFFQVSDVTGCTVSLQIVPSRIRPWRCALIQAHTSLSLYTAA